MSTLTARSAPRTIIGLLAALGLVAAVAMPTLAAAPNVNTGDPITVDGDFSDWTAADFFADMYRAGDPEKQVESQLFLRYDCAGGVLYVGVVAADGVTIIDSDGDNFVKFGNTDKKVDGSDSPPDGTQPEFAYAPDGAGWEASFAIGEVSITDLNVHAQVEDDGSQTSAVADRAIAMSIACEDVEELTPTLTVDKTTSNGDSAFAISGSNGFNQSLTGAAGAVLVASAAGEYTLTETISAEQTGAGWAFTSVDCVGNAIAETAGAGTVTVTVGADEDVTCTFVNTRTSEGTQGGNPTPSPSPKGGVAASSPTPKAATLPNTALGQFDQAPATVLSLVLLGALAATVYIRLARQR